MPPQTAETQQAPGSSAAPSLLHRVDHVDTLAVPLPPSAPTDSIVWVNEIFSFEDPPPWVAALFTIRAKLVPLLGLPAEPGENPFRVREVRTGEALSLAEERHLDFAFGARVHGNRLLATTAVRLHGWRGRLYWMVVSRFHEPVLRAMLRRAVRRVIARG